MCTWHGVAGDAFRANLARRHKVKPRAVFLAAVVPTAKVYSARARRINSVRHAMYAYPMRPATVPIEQSKLLQDSCNYINLHIS